MSIKVSIILPSYNVTNYIEQCVKSVLDQTLQEIEILCVDAGSTDGTLEKLEKLADDNPKIRLIHSEKKSYGYQMNLGIREAKGEYIGIVETDDFVDPDMFEILYRRASKDNADMAKGVLYEVYATEDGGENEILSDYIPVRYMTDITFSPDEQPDVHDWDGNIWNGIYRKEFLTNHEIWFQETPGASYQDIAFQQMVLNEANRVTFLHAHFYHYRKVRPGASTWNPKCVRYIYDAYRGLLADPRIKDSHRKYIYMRMSTAFLYEFRKALCMCGYRIENLECPEAVDWYRAEIGNGIREGVFRFGDLSEVNQRDVTLFFTDTECYVKTWKEKAEALYEWLARLKEAVGGRSLFVFGVGQYGQLLIRFLMRNGVWVDGLVDNQKGKHNTRYFGLNVFSAADAVRQGDCFYLIANKKAGLQIRAQLQKLGVSEESTMIFDGTDQTLFDGMGMYPILP
ncbi:MAG: glycosyltransferase [Lachnospiraceae bacterium]|nr:glycosyltransferase [Lachnospiraceae bacterium]